MLFWAPACSDVQTADVQISNLGRGQPIETVAFHLESAVQSCLKELKIYPAGNKNESFPYPVSCGCYCHCRCWSEACKDWR